MGDYTKMIHAACYVAAYPLDYDKSTIEDMCLTVGAQQVYDFFRVYGSKYGIDTTAQQNWAYALLGDLTKLAFRSNGWADKDGLIHPEDE